MKDYNVTFRKAALMGISRRAAANMRIRFLQQEIHDTLEASKHPVALFWVNEAMEEIRFLVKKANKIVYKSTIKDKITDSDIEAARAVRVDTLINFTRGNAVAWCHEDKKPSLFFASRLGIAICPVCDKKFGAIDVLMDRDGMNFIEAVKELRS